MSLTVNADEKMTRMVTFTLEGSVDTSTYLILERRVNQALQSDDTTFIVFDLQGVEYMSSAGVRVVLKAKKALKKRNGKVFLINLQPQIKKVFDFIKALPSMEAYSIEELDMYLDQIQRDA